MSEYKHIDWKKSLAHILFLDRFTNPRSRKREGSSSYLPLNLREDVDHAIQRFVDSGMLIKPSLAGVIGAIHNKPPIEEMIRKHNIKASGNKPQLIERLIEYAPDAAQAMVGEHDLLVCSAEALTFLETHKQESLAAAKVAKDQAFSALLNGDGKTAYKIYVEYQRAYGNPEMYAGGNYEAKVMEIVLKNEPELLKHLKDQDKKYLRAATCMPMLWRDEPSLKWLPPDFSTKYEDGEVASNLLARYAQIQHQIGDAARHDQVQILFDSYDVDSCDLCRKFDGQVLTASDLPELPDVRCSSRKGCQCTIRPHWDSHYDYSDTEDDMDDDEDIENADSRRSDSIELANILDFSSLENLVSERVQEYIKDNIEIRLDPLSRLRVLKQMLDEKLITTEEFGVIRQRILARI